MKPSLAVKARHFARSPDPASALGLLREIAEQPVQVGPRPVDKRLALYGAGALGKLAKQYFDRLGIPVAFVVDADVERARSDPFWQGVSLQAPGEVADSDKASVLLALCVGKQPFTRVAAPLAAGGWNDIVPFYTISAAYLDRHPLGNGWFSGPLSAADVAGISHVLSGYADDISRAHHLQFLAWHRLHEEWFFEDAQIDTENRYFIPDVTSTLTDDEAFLDLGAHHGGALAAFLDRTQRRFRKIWAVEPDPANLAELDKRLAGYPEDLRARIEVMGIAVGRSDGRERFFAGLDFASQLCPAGDGYMEVRRVDSLGLSPTFVKAHLEGAEMDALLGAAETVRRCRPLIALSVYHNRLGLWECPSALMEAFRDCGYRFLFRLHSWHGTGAVLYLVNRRRAGMPAS
ncbi:MAG TPA: FkbM family methyltransferase [Rhodocyclaceae bacterium]